MTSPRRRARRAREYGFRRVRSRTGLPDSVRTSLVQGLFWSGSDTYTDIVRAPWSFTPRLKIPYGALGFRHSLGRRHRRRDWNTIRKKRRAETPGKSDRARLLRLSGTKRSTCSRTPRSRGHQTYAWSARASVTTTAKGRGEPGRLCVGFKRARRVPGPGTAPKPDANHGRIRSRRRELPYCHRRRSLQTSLAEDLRYSIRSSAA